MPGLDELKASGLLDPVDEAYEALTALNEHDGEDAGEDDTTDSETVDEGEVAEPEIAPDAPETQA